MKNIKIDTVAFLTSLAFAITMIIGVLFASVATAETAVSEEPVVIAPSGSGGSNSDVVATVLVMSLIGIAAAVYHNKSNAPETANCDGISDQTIYGADGKPLVAATTGRCD